MDSLRDFISSISIAFVKTYRVSVILLTATLLFGALSYTTFLKRDGFPAVEFPFGVVSVNYFVDNPNQVDEEVTEPIEKAIGDIDGVQKVQSNTNGNFASIFVQFDTDLTSEEGMQLVKDVVEEKANLPVSAKAEYTPINAGSMDGTNDLIFTLSGDKTTEEFQKKAEEVAEAIETNSAIKEAAPVDLISIQIDPATGEEFTYEESFRRHAERNENGQLVFQPAISVGVKKEASISSVELSEAVRSEIEDLEEDGKLKGYTVGYGGDIADGLNEQIGSLESNAFTGLLAVIVVLFLFVNWRASIVTAFFIPTVMAATFTGLLLIGYSLNVISLFALILVLGLFVDDATVVVEAIDYQKKKGVKGLKAVREAVRQVSIADVSGTLTTILVFVPMAAISGILGEFIRPIPVTVIMALALSLVVALTLIPLLTHILIPPTNPEEKKQRKPLEMLLNAPNSLVKKIGELIYVFDHAYLGKIWGIALVIIFAVMMIVGSFGIFGSKLKFAVFPNPKDSDQIMVIIDYPENTEIGTAEVIANDAEKTLEKVAGENLRRVDYIVGNRNQAQIIVDLIKTTDRDVKAPEIVDELNAQYEEYGAATVKASMIATGPPESEYQFGMQVFVDDAGRAERLADDIKDFVQVQTLEGGDVEVLEVKVDFLQNIAKTDGKRYYQINAKLTEGASTGAVVELRDAIKAEYTNEKLKSEFALDEDSLGFDLGQESENLESFASTVYALMFALAIMYVLLVIQFNSFTQPLLVFVAIPLTLPGLIPGLQLTDNPFSFFTMIGFIGLMGIVVNNTIMLLDYANQIRAEKKASAREAISEAVKIRFRPLVTTTATTLAGLTPLALSDPFWEALAFTIIFGLISSTLMVIFVFPAFYVILEKLRGYKTVLAGKILRVAGRY